MKRKVIITSILVIAVAITATAVTASHFRSKGELNFFGATKNTKTDKTVAATVNNTKIYQHQIDFQRASQQLSKENAENSGYDASKITVQTDKEILDELIRNEVVLQEAKKQKLAADYSEAKKYIKSNYDAIIEKNDENAKILKEYMNELELDEDEYIKQASEAYQNVLTRSNLYESFIKGKIGTADELQQQYEIYVSELIKAASIKYN